ncbi:hypothetical protein AC1031_015668 [Aphanomyces cochlioides]|nr:hypothetical protein AC1031_015668 [Aphanomyces cochlioides]
MGNKTSKAGGGGGSSKGLRPGVNSEATQSLRPQPLPQTRAPNASAPVPHYRQQDKVPNAVPVASITAPPAAPTTASAAATEPDSDGEDISGPSEQVTIKEADGSTVVQAKVSIEDFDLLKVLGKGSFGKVMMVRKKDNQKIYAMKTLRKAALIKRNQLLHTKTERNILQQIKHPFLTTLSYAFQTPEKLYLVMDYCPGGELFFWLKKDRRFSQSKARLFAAEILLALQELHSHDIIYRDLKPENILLDLEGHIRLTDFGLSKEAVTGAGAVGGTKTFCGTPEYLAPEILENKGHGKVQSSSP